MGFGSVMVPPGTYPIQRAEATAGLQSIGGPPWPPTSHDADSWIAALGALPLMYQPGEQWLYGTSGQVLGVVLARACGQDLGSVLRERVLEPLGMVDTGFTVPAAQLGRLATAYRPDPASGELAVLDGPPDSWWAAPPSFPDAAGWLVSTIDDLWAFVSMLIAGGAGPDGPVLSSGAVARMTADRLTLGQRETSRMFLGEHSGWGLGLAVPAADAPADAPLPCGIGWDGGIGTTWRTDLRRGLTGILLTQREVMSPVPSAMVQEFWAGIDAAAASVSGA
jgi:CubicO group peptidase (beta-lactamase class C family)